MKEGIQKGRFQDGPRMERLDVTFANRYLEADVVKIIEALNQTSTAGVWSGFEIRGLIEG